MQLIIIKSIVHKPCSKQNKEFLILILKKVLKYRKVHKKFPKPLFSEDISSTRLVSLTLHFNILWTNNQKNEQITREDKCMKLKMTKVLFGIEML